MKRVGLAIVLTLACLGITVLQPTVRAVTMSDNNFTLDPNVTSSFGGEGESPSYRLVDAGGETAVGEAESANYAYTAGYVSQLDHSISLNVDQASIALPIMVAGESKSATVTASVVTDGAGYSFGVYQDHDLRNVSEPSKTIDPITATVDLPTVWQEGTTAGLGFTLGESAHVPALWGNAGAPKYAAVPQTLATLFTTASLASGVPQDTSIAFRLATAHGQQAGNYTNTITYVVTAGL